MRVEGCWIVAVVRQIGGREGVVVGFVRERNGLWSLVEAGSVVCCWPVAERG